MKNAWNVYQKMNSMNKCLHENKIENIDSSYLICQNCGVQVQQVYRSTFGNSKPLSVSITNYEKNDSYEFIENCVERLNLPSCMCKEIFNHYIKIKEKSPSKNIFHL